MILACLIAITTAQRAATATESDPDLLLVVETYWGFDGRVPLHEFVPLSIQLKNLGPTPWQGTIELSRVVRGNRQFGATIIEEVHLQGDETRWMQIAPYVIDDLEDWEIRWGDGDNHVITLPPVIKGEHSTVLVYDTDDVSQSSSVFKRMPQERFPTSVTATHGLRGIVLDQVPFWQGARARAFLDWIRQGGRVYLLQNSEGTFPVFPSALDFLNSEQSQFQVGAGTIKKIAAKVEDFTLNEARSQIFNDDVKQTEPTEQSQTKQKQQTSVYGMHELVWSKHYDTFKKLTELSVFKRRWWLIYIAVFSYLAVLYPGCYTIGVQQKKVSQFYFAFFAAACFFALTFGLLGQVGGQSKNRVRSITLAQSLGEGDFELTGWTVLSNIFAGEHSVTFPGSGQVYSTTQEAEYVNGTLNPGTGGNVTFEMLPDTRRTLHHRARIRTNRPLPTVRSNSSDELGAASLLINTTGCFTDEPLYAIVVFRGHVYELEVDSNLLSMKRTQSPKTLSTFLLRQYDFGFNMWGTRIKNEDDEDEEKKLTGLKRYMPLMRQIVGNSFGLVEEIDPRQLKLSPQTLRLFVMTATPAEFEPQTNDFPDKEGVTVFSYDLEI